MISKWVDRTKWLYSSHTRQDFIVITHYYLHFISDNVPTTTNGVCYTSADSPSSPNQRCVFPFRYYGKLTQECLLDKGGKRWCSTKVDEYKEHVRGDGNWGYCSPSCNGNTTTLQSEKGATFSKRNLAWKGKSFLLTWYQFSGCCYSYLSF